MYTAFDEVQSTLRTDGRATLVTLPSKTSGNKFKTSENNNSDS